jgi:hypothetical protein
MDLEKQMLQDFKNLFSLDDKAQDGLKLDICLGLPLSTTAATAATAATAKTTAATAATAATSNKSRIRSRSRSRSVNFVDEHVYADVDELFASVYYPGGAYNQILRVKIQELAVEHAAQLESAKKMNEAIMLFGLHTSGPSATEFYLANESAIVTLLDIRSRL